ncbi:MAG: hypothetical protein IPJ19_16765 [Planctomycetes bacterium]|nr:hypothetical protein [Planctomycetota bacterium]
MALRRFLVTGVGRSGTGYTASLLTELGCPTGHEEVFGPPRLRNAGQITWPPDVAGDSSWLGAPYLDALPEGTVVLHQVREPVANVRSSLRIQFFSTPSWYRIFAEEHAPTLLVGSEPERCLRYWLEWNRMAERAREMPALEYFRYRLEDIDHALVGEICARIGLEVTPARIAEVLEQIPRDYNTRRDKQNDGDWRWSELPPGGTKRAVEQLAASYGYGPETAEGTLHVQPRAQHASG